MMKFYEIGFVLSICNTLFLKLFPYISELFSFFPVRIRKKRRYVAKVPGLSAL
jgi:hypothetical protein